MKKSRLFKFSIVLGIVMASTITAFADWTLEEAIEDKDFTTSNITASDIQTYAKGDGVIGDGKVWTSDNAKELEKRIRSNDKGEDSTGTQITIDGVTYTLDADGMQNCRNYMVSVAKKHDVKSSVDTMGVNFNVGADIDAAGTALSGFEGLVSTIIGVALYIVVLGMTLFTAIDICYITLPVFRGKCDSVGSQGGNMSGQTRDGESKMRFVTDEAIYAVKACTIDSGKNPMGTYMKKRLLAYVMVAIVIYILVTGNVQLIVNIALNLVSGIMDALGGLGA